MSQPLTDPVLSRLEAELEPWPRLLVIADRLEELGEDRLAWGYRWLAKHRNGQCYANTSGAGPVTVAASGGSPQTACPWSLPSGSRNALACWAGTGTNSIPCPTLSAPRLRLWP
jgi:hypothetical protein